MDLETIKNKIETLTKTQQIEVLRIIKKHPTSKLNENKNGIYINLTFLPIEAIQELQEFIQYTLDQEEVLTPLETQKQDFKKTFFIEKEDKDNMTF
uniref:NET domain-containing protein n=1 Tax=viral metagenome TaxID=1070528 RepID=A0A6C0HZF9_9ZZZZ